MVREMAEIACLSCGRDLGKVERVDRKVRLIPANESPNTAVLVRKSGVGLACGRCGGRALVGPMERIITYAA